ncbi:MAG: response regulator transcription factor [Planctomycetota bacterium]|nr:response regulator transcription factor [Planctomycetota bacterium]
MRTTVLLVDDHDMVRASLRAVLDAQPDIIVVAEAGDGRTAVQLARHHKPQVVLMDVIMPGLNGIEATIEIKRFLPETRILALSGHADWLYVNSMLNAGASGFLVKSMAIADLLRAIRTVASDNVYLSPDMVGNVVKAYMAGPAKGASRADVSLSGRERQVLQLLAEGNTSKEIAFRLHLSTKTVETHRQRIMNRLNLHTVAALTKFAILHGLTALDP